MPVMLGNTELWLQVMPTCLYDDRGGCHAVGAPSSAPEAAAEPEVEQSMITQLWDEPSLQVKKEKPKTETKKEQPKKDTSKDWKRRRWKSQRRNRG